MNYQEQCRRINEMRKRVTYNYRKSVGGSIVCDLLLDGEVVCNSGRAEHASDAKWDVDRRFNFVTGEAYHECDRRS